jgi:hypothetical protein
MQGNTEAFGYLTNDSAFYYFILFFNGRSTWSTDVLPEDDLQFGRDSHLLNREISGQLFCFRRMNPACKDVILLIYSWV